MFVLLLPVALPLISVNIMSLFIAWCHLSCTLFPIDVTAVFLTFTVCAATIMYSIFVALGYARACDLASYR